jgi:hypothetical protein
MRKEILNELSTMEKEILSELSTMKKDITGELSTMRKEILSELSTIKETIMAIKGTVDRTWELVLRRGERSSTVTRGLENLGKVSITAEPAKDLTIYYIEIEKPILKEGFFRKKAGEPDFVNQETKILGKKGEVMVLTPNYLKYILPSTDPKACTEFITFLLKWLNSTYVESLKEIKEFEEPILTG